MVRNRIRRRLRSVSREAGPLLRPGAYLVGAHPGASSLSYRELRATLCEALATLATKELPGPAELPPVLRGTPPPIARPIVLPPDPPAPC